MWDFYHFKAKINGRLLPCYHQTHFLLRRAARAIAPLHGPMAACTSGVRASQPSHHLQHRVSSPSLYDTCPPRLAPGGMGIDHLNEPACIIVKLPEVIRAEKKPSLYSTLWRRDEPVPRFAAPEYAYLGNEYAYLGNGDPSCPEMKIIVTCHSVSFLLSLQPSWSRTGRAWLVGGGTAAHGQKSWLVGGGRTAQCGTRVAT